VEAPRKDSVRKDGPRREARAKSWGESRNEARAAARIGPRANPEPDERPRSGARPDRTRPDRTRPGGRTERRSDAPSDRAAGKDRRPGNLRPAGSRKVAEGAINLLDAMFPNRETGDRVRQAWMKQHHKLYDEAEREALLHIVDEVLRLRGRLDWWIGLDSKAGRTGLPPDNRLRVAAWRILSSGAKTEGLLPLFPAGDNAIEALLRRLEGHTLEHPEMPPAEKYSVPDWIMPQLQRRFGADLDLELAAMLRAAPLDVRVNRLKTTREAAGAALQAEGLRSQPTPFSPIGLRLSPQAYVNNTRAHAEGLIEPQDEGSQLAAQLVDAGGKKFVVDFCAGAGGKTLVLAAAMQNVGRLVAMDVSKGRLAQAKLRLRRAGVHNAECRELDGKWIKRHAEKAERVLVDAPCTGTGTWRRKPDAKWRLTRQDLTELVFRQAEILDRAAKLVQPGGRLVYVTCSVLVEENEDQVAAFLQRHSDFSVLPVTDVWAQTIGGACPVPGPYLSLSPGRHGTDGFFAAILLRNR
jgi:16S rRNA (cytosine967-C5)-methyltransferase